MLLRLSVACVFRYDVFRFDRHSTVRRLLPASDYCRERVNEIVGYSSHNETVQGSSRMLTGARRRTLD